MGVHDGHRDRLREIFETNGIECFNDINALELLLFYAVPRKDTNPIAHELLNRFGSLEEVFSASFEELTEVPGIGKNAATLIRLVPEMVKKSQISKANQATFIHSSADAGKYLLPRFLNEKDEVLYMLCLDGKGEVICCLKMGHGTVNAVETNIRRMVETALKRKASRVVVAHNHPNGVALPSKEDDYFTKKLCEAFRILSIRLEDHIIVAQQDYVSLADSGMLNMYRY